MKAFEKDQAMLIAMTRKVSPIFDRCELTHLERQIIDVELARVQHDQYEKYLASLGCIVRSLPAEPELPDSTFIEDVAVVLDELAVIANPGAESRQAETFAVAEALSSYRSLAFIQPPGTLDGGDILRIGKRLFTGLSQRTNKAGIEQLDALVRPLGYSIEVVQVTGCLHLKSAVTCIGEDLLLMNNTWIEPESFPDFDVVEVDPSEPHAANALWVGETVIYPSNFPSTQARLEDRGLDLGIVDVSEIGKAEGGVTCCSLIFES